MDKSKNILKKTDEAFLTIKDDNYYKFIFTSCLLSFTLSVLVSLPFNFEISDIWWSYLPVHIIYLMFCSLTLVVFETLGRIFEKFISVKLKQTIYKFYFRVSVGFIFLFPIFLVSIFLSENISQ